MKGSVDSHCHRVFGLLCSHCLLLLCVFVPALVFSYDFHAGAETMFNRHFNDPTADSYFTKRKWGESILSPTHSTVANNTAPPRTFFKLFSLFIDHRLSLSAFGLLRDAWTLKRTCVCVCVVMCVFLSLSFWCVLDSFFHRHWFGKSHKISLTKTLSSGS